jgi:hypothetical protein
MKTFSWKIFPFDNPFNLFLVWYSFDNLWNALFTKYILPGKGNFILSKLTTTTSTTYEQHFSEKLPTQTPGCHLNKCSPFRQVPLGQPFEGTFHGIYPTRQTISIFPSHFMVILCTTYGWHFSWKIPYAKDNLFKTDPIPLPLFPGRVHTTGTHWTTNWRNFPTYISG